TFTPDSRLVATGARDGLIRRFDTATSALVTTVVASDDFVYGIAFSPDGTRMANGGRDGVIRLWDTRTWDEVIQLHGHDAYVYSVDFSPDGACLVSGSGDGTVRLWETRPLRARIAARDARRERVTRLAPLVRERLDQRTDPTSVADELREALTDDQDLEMALQILLSASLEERHARDAANGPVVDVK
ncbi:MAG: WD40 repeat domain-containing protein, partial [Planctomycetota bacterium]